MKINPKRLALLVILFFATHIILVGQSKYEFGIGFSINHSKINDDIKTQNGPGVSLNKGTRLLGLTSRIGYKFNDRFHLNSGLGFTWLGSLRKDHSSREVARMFELPVQLEWNMWKHIQFSSGPVYNYILGMYNEFEGEKFDLINLVKTRHQLGLRHSISFSYDLIEISLAYTHYMTDLYNLAVADINDNIIGSKVSRFQNIQIGVVLRR